MIKLIIFDLDGVLCNTREWHYDSLNVALEAIDKKYVIGREEHLAHFDGLPTSKKLKKLTEMKGLPPETYQRVWKLKQDSTIDIIKRVLNENVEAFIIMSYLKNEGYKIAVASNSIRDTVRVALDKMKLLGQVDFYYSNEDVRKPKPSTEMYLKAMLDAGADPKETVIIEDSHVGRKAVINSGAHLLAVRNVEDVKLDTVVNFLNRLNEDAPTQPKWHGGEMNVLIPMAGTGHSFEMAGYTFPKPLIEINGKTMIQLVVENLNIHAKHIFVVRKEHYEKYNLKQLLNIISPNCEVIISDGVQSDGAVRTTLLAKDLINNNHPLIIANCDQYIEWNANEFMYSMTSDHVDGGIAVFTSTHPRWSFVKLNEHGYVSEVAEKIPISNIATCGIYYWSKGHDYVKYAEQMIERKKMVNNQYYVAPVYNEAIEDNKTIKIYPVQKMTGLGTPEEVTKFINSRL